jgi:signal transduction histidine kinase
MIEVDVVQLQMVVAAIVNNADEAITSDGSIRIATEQISLSESASESTEAPALDLDPGYYACITIKDSGQGMDQEMQRRIFDPFYSTKFEGRGLNMAAVYSIVKNHGGNIAVSSRIGHGTRVRIFLPLIETSSDEQ